MRWSTIVPGWCTPVVCDGGLPRFASVGGACASAENAGVGKHVLFVSGGMWLGSAMLATQARPAGADVSVVVCFWSADERSGGGLRRCASELVGRGVGENGRHLLDTPLSCPRTRPNEGCWQQGRDEVGLTHSAVGARGLLSPSEPRADASPFAGGRETRNELKVRPFCGKLLADRGEMGAHASSPLLRSLLACPRPHTPSAYCHCHGGSTPQAHLCAPPHPHLPTH